MPSRAAGRSPRLDLEALAPQVDRLRAKLGLPGVAVAVWRAGEIQAFGCGRDGGALQQPVSAASRFPLACIVKLVTARLLLGMAERGELDLADDVGRRLSGEASSRARGVTAAQLLNHTAGLVSGADRPLLWPLFDPWAEEGHLGGLAAVSAPGLVFSYSHTSHLLAAQVAQERAGRPWRAMVEQLFAELAQEALSGPDDAGATSGHIWRGAGDVRSLPGHAENQAEDEMATGVGLYASVEAIARLGASFLTSEEAPARTGELSDAWLLAMRSGGPRPRHGATPYPGLGLRRFSRSVFGHRGEGPGHHAALYILPEQAAAVAIACNAGADALAKSVLALMGVDDFDIDLLAPPAQAGLPPAACVGRYACGPCGLELLGDGGRLRVRALGASAAGAAEASLVAFRPNLYFGRLAGPTGAPPSMLVLEAVRAGAEVGHVRLNEVAFARAA